MRRLAFVPVLALLLALTVVPTAQAQMCVGEGFPQADMAGVYVSPVHQMRVEIYSCGTSFVMWDNGSGTYSSHYVSTNRIRGGGIAATGVTEVGRMPTYLDGSTRIGFKPGTPGYLEVITLGIYDETYTTYRLKKAAY